MVERLVELGADVDVVDPILTDQAIRLRGVTAASDVTLTMYDLALVLTDHDDVDYDTIARQSVAVFDTRAAYRRRG